MTFVRDVFETIKHLSEFLVVKFAYKLLHCSTMRAVKRRRLPGKWEKRVRFLVSGHQDFDINTLWRCPCLGTDEYFSTNEYFMCITHKLSKSSSRATIVCESYVGDKKCDLSNTTKLESCFKSLFIQFTSRCLHQDISPEEVDVKIIATGFDDEHSALLNEVKQLHQLKRAIEAREHDVYASRICDKMIKLNKRKH